MSDFSIEGFRKGYYKEFNYIFNLYSEPICSYASRIVEGDSEDITEETFCKLWNSRMQFQNLAHIKGFLYITTRNACIDRLRSLQKQHEAHWEFSHSEDRNIYSSEPNNSELLLRIYKAVERLPFKCRTVFKLIYFDGFGTRAVAEILGISNQNVLNQKARALQILRASVPQPIQD